MPNRNRFRFFCIVHGIATMRRDDLKKAYREEKDPRAKIRVATVNMMCMNNGNIRHTADPLMQCPNRVSMWVERFKEGGMAPSGTS